MLRAFIAGSLISLSAQAGYLDTICNSNMQNPPVAFGEGVVASRINQDYVLSTLEGKTIFASPTRIRSVVVNGEDIWLLSSSTLLHIKNDGTMIDSYPMDMSLSMTKADNNLLIVRGGGTLTAFSMSDKKEIWTNYLNEISDGDAVSVAFDGKNGQVVFTGNRENGFNGVATVEMTAGNIIKKVPYDISRAGVVDPDAKVRWFNNSLVLNNGGWIHVITAEQLAKGKAVKPRWVASAIGQGMDRHYMMLRGEFFFEGKDLVGCGLYNERQDGNLNRLSKLFKVTMP
jgi:hypothetical protein